MIQRRRPKGEAADTILKALEECEGSISMIALQERTGLPTATLRDNVMALRRQGKVETFRGDLNTLWVAKPT
jgi:DNA-binding IclR family transcriptional regulator